MIRRASCVALLALVGCGGGDFEALEEPQKLATCDVIFRAAYMPSQQGDIRLTDPEEASRDDLLDVGRERADMLRFGWSKYVVVGDFFEECP